MLKIGIFCSASENIVRTYYEQTEKLGMWIGKNKNTIIYGGTAQGLMECIAQSVQKSGGETIGVLPQKMYENKLASATADQIIITQDLTERKNKIMSISDIFIALPGGFGTLDEIFHIVACGQIGYHDKRLLLLNINGFYNHLIQQIEQAFVERFTPIEYKERICVVETVDDCIKELSKEKR